MLQRRGYYYLLLAVATVGFLIMVGGLVSAEITVSTPQSTYNLGDNFDATATLLPAVNTQGFASVSLVCLDYDSLELYRSPESLSAGESKTLKISVKFDRYLIGDRNGECALRASFGDETVDSVKFQLGTSLLVMPDVLVGVYNPGEQFSASGTVKKTNGNSAKGFVEVRIPELEFVSTTQLSNGSFRINVTLPSQAAAQMYTLILHAYEKDSQGEITNEGSSSQIIRIRPVVNHASIALSSTNVTPAADVMYTILLSDQSGASATNDVSVSIRSPVGTEIVKKLVPAGQVQSIHIDLNQTPGSWVVEAKLGAVSAHTSFYVEEVERASFTLSNDTLVVKNIGNVPYQKPVEVSVGDLTEIKEMILPVGQTKRIKLFAQKGLYTISVSDGSEKQVLGVAELKSSEGITGYAIGLGKSILPENARIVVWIILILILIAVAYWSYVRIQKKNYTGSFSSSKKQTTLPFVASSAPRPAGVTKSTSVIDQGHKQVCSVVAIKIKNNEDLKKPGSNAEETIQKALHQAKTFNCKIYADSSYRLLIFSPTISSEHNTALRAAQAANELKSIFDAHNRKFVDKIDYGIGINSGELIVEKHDHDFKFSSIGTTVISAKKAAQVAQREILLSEMAYRKGIGPIKTEPIPGLEFHRLVKIVDRTAHNDFIDRFKRRQQSS